MSEVNPNANGNGNGNPNPNPKQKDFISWLIDGALSLVFGRPSAPTNITYGNGYPSSQPNTGPKPGCGCGMKK
jgi:hypothetical protein